MRAKLSALVLFVAGGTLSLLGSTAHAASCCGGGGGSTLILPKVNDEMVAIAYDTEHYDGLWRRDGTWVPDPPGADLNQYRMHLGYARRFASEWQGSISVPYVWNHNTYGGLSRRSEGLGDTTLSVWYETFENVMCVYRVEEWRDLIPAIYLGGGLVVPTGVSPYGNVADNFDITGRGFYRFDATVLAEKTVYPWNVGLQLTYGTHLARPVNREYGRDIAPYTKHLGDRASGSLSFGYTWMTDEFASWTMTLAYAALWEGRAAVNGKPDPTTGIEQRTLAATLAWASPDRAWLAKLSWSHAPRQDDQGANFPTTDVITVGLNRVLH